jgi:hypothetical protein
MALLIEQHKVRDYPGWRPFFDAHKSSQTGAGLTNPRVYRKTDDPNDVVILFDVSDVAKARAWVGGADLKNAMQMPASSARPQFTSSIDLSWGARKPVVGVVGACNSMPRPGGLAKPVPKETLPAGHSSAARWDGA